MIIAQQRQTLFVLWFDSSIQFFFLHVAMAINLSSEAHVRVILATTYTYILAYAISGCSFFLLIKFAMFQTQLLSLSYAFNADKKKYNQRSQVTWYLFDFVFCFFFLLNTIIVMNIHICKNIVYLWFAHVVGPHSNRLWTDDCSIRLFIFIRYHPCDFIYLIYDVCCYDDVGL